jgi:hypothetical protein
MGYSLGAVAENNASTILKVGLQRKKYGKLNGKINTPRGS